MFDRFKNRYVIEGEIVAVTALHIGMAQEQFKPNEIKNPFLRDAQDLPLIPGSSLKGVMRSFMEQYLSSDAGKEMLSGEKRKKVCTPAAPCVDAAVDKEWKNLLEKGKEKEIAEYLFGKDSSEEQLNSENNDGNLCVVCRLFGCPYSAAKFSVRDAKVIEETFQNEFEIRSGVAIDRELGIKRDKHLFDMEVVPEGTKFSFQAVLENAQGLEVECIQLLLQAMEYGLISIGGMKSRGLGGMRLENVRYQKIDCKNIRTYLSGKEIPFLPLEQMEK